jgi:hypothetical protein
MTGVSRIARAARRRLIVDTFQHLAGRLTVLALAVSIAWIALDRTLGVAMPIALLIATPLGVAWLTAAGLAFARRPDALAALTRIDTRLKLHDALATAHALEASGAFSPPTREAEAFASLTRTRAEGMSSRLRHQLREATPVRLDNQWLYAAVLACVLTLTAALFPTLNVLSPEPPRIDVTAAEAEVTAAREEAQDALAQSRDELASLELDAGVEDELRQLEELEQSLAAADNPDAVRAETAAELDTIADALEAESAEAERRQETVRQAFDRAAARETKPLDDFRKAMSEEDYERALQSLEELRELTERGSEAEQQQIREDIESFSEALSQQSEALREEASEATSQAQRLLEEQGLSAPDAEKLADMHNPDEIRRELEDRGLPPDLADRLSREIDESREQAAADEAGAEDLEQLSDRLRDIAEPPESADSTSPPENQESTDTTSPDSVEKPSEQPPVSQPADADSAAAEENPPADTPDADASEPGEQRSQSTQEDQPSQAESERAAEQDAASEQPESTGEAKPSESENAGESTDQQSDSDQQSGGEQTDAAAESEGEQAQERESVEERDAGPGSTTGEQVADPDAQPGREVTPPDSDQPDREGEGTPPTGDGEEGGSDAPPPTEGQPDPDGAPPTGDQAPPTGEGAPPPTGGESTTEQPAGETGQDGGGDKPPSGVPEGDDGAGGDLPPDLPPGDRTPPPTDDPADGPREGDPVDPGDSPATDPNAPTGTPPPGDQTPPDGQGRPTGPGDQSGPPAEGPNEDTGAGGEGVGGGESPPTLEELIRGQQESREQADETRQTAEQFRRRSEELLSRLRRDGEMDDRWRELLESDLAEGEDITYDAVDARSRDSSGRVVSELPSEQSRQEGEQAVRGTQTGSGAGRTPTPEEALRAAEQAAETQRVPAKYRKLLRKYFDRRIANEAERERPAPSDATPDAPSSAGTTTNQGGESGE